jgi:pimeloyl-ACP methyl ester carboxylesterase
MTTVSTADAVVHFSTHGEGPGLALVHGTGADSVANFGHLVEKFSDRNTVITPDYAGSGATKDHGGPITLDALTEQVAAAIRAASDEPVDVLGFSLGAVVAATVAAKHPELVRRLVLVAGWQNSADARHQLTFNLWRKLADLDEDSYARLIILLLFTPGFLSRMGSEGLAEAVAGTRCSDGTNRQIDLGLDIDISELVARIEARTLVVGCTHDQLVPVGHSRELHESIPNSSYTEIDSGHLVVVEWPEELVRVTRDFLHAES